MSFKDGKVHDGNHEFSQKWAKDNMKKIMRQPLNRAERDLFLQV